MSDVTVDFPMNESITLEVGEKLTLKFTEECHPCWDPEDQGLFDHRLPHHDHKKGYEWTGTAIKNGTIECSYVSHGEHCGEKNGATSSVRSIKVGSDGYKK